MPKWEIFAKEWRAEHAGHSLLVRNSWTSGMQLYVDGRCRGSTSRLLALRKSRPALVCELETAGGGRSRVEVFAYGLFTVKARIVVDGQQVGGDRF